MRITAFRASDEIPITNACTIVSWKTSCVLEFFAGTLWSVLPSVSQS